MIDSIRHSAYVHCVLQNADPAVEVMTSAPTSVGGGMISNSNFHAHLSLITTQHYSLLPYTAILSHTHHTIHSTRDPDL